MPGTARDAAELERVLGDPRIGDFEVTVLQDATVRAAGLMVRDFFSHADPDDMLLLHISGHGERDSDGNLYFVNHDTMRDSLWVTGLKADHISAEIRDSPARRIVVLLDCCYAGAFVQHDGVLAGLGPEKPPASTPMPGYKAGNPDDRHHRGEVVITAATSIEHAYESDAGLFTRCVVHGLETGRADMNRDGAVDSYELYQYVAARMRRDAATPRQSPTYSAHRMQGILRIAHSARDLAPDRPPPPRPAPAPATVPRGRGPLPRRVLLPLLVVAGLLCGCGIQADGAVAGGGCPAPAQVRVAAAPGGLGAYREVAAGFEGWVAERQHGCRAVDLYVYPAAVDDLTEGLRRGWGVGGDGRDYLRDVGPHPDVWLPAAADEVPPDSRDVIDRVELIGQTPIVLGVPARARIPGDEEQRPSVLSLPALLAAVGGRHGVVRGDFAGSAVARMATATLYQDGTLDPALARTDIEQPLERFLDSGGYPVGDEAALLCHQRRVRGSTAVLLTEQQVVRFNRGDAPDGGCVGGAAPAAGDRLHAFYPATTPAVRQVAVTLNWPRSAQGGTARSYAAWFVRWLRQKPGRQALLRSGLRPIGLDAADPIGPANGALADWPFAHWVPGEPNALTRRDVAALYAAARRPGRFLVALDASGSMNTVTADPDRTRFEVAAAAVEQAASRLGRRDELGLLTFSGRSAREVLPIAAAGGDPVGRVRRSAAGIRPAGDTPLYEAVRRGAAALRAGPGDAQRTLVVLTDGKDTSGQPRPSAAQTAGVRIFVIAVGDVSCADAALAALTTDSGGRCFDAGPDSLQPALTSMFRAVWDMEGD
ncbi:caspase family protein [Actinoplanes digitatis]|uniref:caspase family protein n=1 Tax=Actinoplanes digitatis TaxID=1868 RepID=UPI001EF27DD9|nr:caspase family protein [Actinoplanes digitatis]